MVIKDLVKGLFQFSVLFLAQNVFALVDLCTAVCGTAMAGIDANRVNCAMTNFSSRCL